MLAQRKRGRTRGTAPGGEGNHDNGLLSYGNNDAVNGAKLGLGFKSAAFFDYPQRVIDLTKIVQVAVGSGTAIALDDEGRVYTFANGEVGNGGIGDANVEMFDPTQVTGGVPLYPQADLTTKKEAWRQVRGPVGPRLPTKKEYEKGEATWYVVAVASSASHSMALTSHGQVLHWGSNNGGALANGWETDAAGDSKRAAEEKENGIYPQMAPFWALTGGPVQSETGKNPRGMKLLSGVEGTAGAVYAYDSPWGTGTGANVLKGVRAISCAQHLSFYLKGDELWYSGSPKGAGTYQSNYAIKDTVWDPTNPAHLPVGYHVIAIDGTRQGCLLLLSNGTHSENLTRYVGYIREYVAGDGKLQSSSTTVREVATPSTSAGVPVKGVLAIAKGEYSCKYLKTDGTVWTSGSNAMHAQGLGHERGEPCEYVTQIPLARKAIAISSDGEEVLGPPVAPPNVPGFIGAGVNGGDMTGILLDDHTALQFGDGFLPSTGAGGHWEGIGSLGTGDSDHHSTPTAPLGSLTNIAQICAGCVQTMLIQDPGAPGRPTLSATCVSPGAVLVKFSPPPGPVGSLPNVRAAEGYEVRLTREGFSAVGVTILPGEPLEHLFTGLAPGTWSVIVNEKQTAVEPAFTSGLALVSGKWVGTGSGGLLAVGWGNPPVGKDEVRWILEWHHAGTYESKGKVKEEDWTRCTPDPIGAARAYTIPIAPSKNGIPGETIEGKVYGYFSGRAGQTEGAYKKRTRDVLVS